MPAENVPLLPLHLQGEPLCSLQLFLRAVPSIYPFTPTVGHDSHRQAKRPYRGSDGKCRLIANPNTKAMSPTHYHLATAVLPWPGYFVGSHVYPGAQWAKKTWGSKSGVTLLGSKRSRDLPKVTGVSGVEPEVPPLPMALRGNGGSMILQK